MIVTQKEAKRMWCPHARTIDQDMIGATVNRDVGKGFPDSDCYCLGDRCMAWRWAQPPMRQVSQKPVDGWEHVPADDSEEYAEHWLEPWESAQSKRPGYCALAGKPENLNA